MNMHDPMEEVLKGYRPAGPPAALRQRVLGAAAAARDRTSWRPSPFWMAITAMIVLSAGLHWAVRDVSARTTRMVGIGPAEWNESAEQAAYLMGGDFLARRYIALGLMASDDLADPATRSVL